MSRDLVPGHALEGHGDRTSAVAGRSIAPANEPEPRPARPRLGTRSRDTAGRDARGADFRATEFVARLAAARIGATYNQYADSPLRRERLRAYLEARRDARVLLVGEAAGYLGARVSGIAFTSERQLTGSGPAEISATIVHRALAEFGLADDVLLWNLVPTHPQRSGAPASNRPPTRAEIDASRPFLDALAASGPSNRLLLAVGRLAERELGAPYVRHPSHGGASAFRATLAACLS